MGTLFDIPEPVSDDELEATLTAALHLGGGKITRAVSRTAPRTRAA
jgi:hypothetical protein